MYRLSLDKCTWVQIQDYIRQLLKTDELQFMQQTSKYDNDLSVVLGTTYVAWNHHTNM